MRYFLLGCTFFRWLDNKINKKQEKIYFSLAVAIILLSVLINMINMGWVDSDALITGYVAEEIYDFGIPITNGVVTTSTTIEHDKDLIITSSTTTSSSTSTIIDFNITDVPGLIDETSKANAIRTNLTNETGLEHLTLNDSSLVLYMSFDINTSVTTTYDYSSNNNDGTYNGSYFVSQGYFGGGAVL